MNERAPLTWVQIGVLTAAFLPMLATGVIGGIGTYSNISAVYGKGTALGALGAGEGATAVLALVLLGLTLLGQSSPRIIRTGLWALPAAAAAMGAMAAPDAGRTVIYALTPLGMSVSAEGMAFLARRIVVHTDGRDAEHEQRTADLVQALAYHRARAAHHPSDRVQWWSERKSWRLARKVGVGDTGLGSRLLNVQRERVTTSADAALASMFAPGGSILTPITNAEESTETDRKRSTPDLPESTPAAITLTRLPIPDPAPVDKAMSLKPFPSIKPTSVAPIESTSVAAIESAPVASIEGRSAAAESSRPRRVTGRVPDAAKSPRPKRTPDQLIDEARAVTAGWPDVKVTAEGIRRELRTSPANARMLRDAILTDRAAKAEKAA